MLDSTIISNSQLFHFVVVFSDHVPGNKRMIHSKCQCAQCAVQDPSHVFETQKKLNSFRKDSTHKTMSRWHITDICQVKLRCTGETKEFNSKRTLDKWFKLHGKKCEDCDARVVTSPPQNFIMESHTPTDVARNIRQQREYAQHQRLMIES